MSARQKHFISPDDIERMMSDVTKQDWERLNSVFQATPLPTFIWQASIADDFELIDFNKAAVDFAGEKLKGNLNIRASLYYKDEPDILGDFKFCYNEKTTLEREVAYGSNSYGEANFLNVKYLFIQPNLILVQLQEISKLKEVRKVLTDHIKQQAAFIENSPAAIAMFDKEMKYISASNKWVTDYNLKGKEIIGKSHYTIFPEIGKEWKAIHQHCLQGGIEKREEDSFVGVDGVVVWLQWEIHPWYQDSKEVGGIVMFTEDISERKAKEDLIEKMNEKLVAQNELLKQAKEKIELNETRLIEAQHAAKLGSWETDLSTLHVVWSEQTFAIFELDSSVFSPTHDSFLSFVHEEDKEEVSDAFVSSLSSKSYSSIEHRIISAKGNLKYVEEHWRVLKDEQGVASRVFGSCQDITERKLIELELNHSRRQVVENEYRLKLAIDTGELGVWDWDLLGDEVIWNDLMSVIYGIEKDLTRNKYQVWVDSLHPEDKEMEINKLRQAVENLDDYNTSFRIVKGCGEIAYIKADSVILRNERGKPYRIIGINKDITAQKNAENKLVAYKHFFQNSKDFLNISNTKGYCEVVNPQMVKVLGYSEEELLSKSYYELIHPDDQAATSAEVEELSIGNETQNLQLRHLKKSGEYISIEWNVMPDEQTGKIYSIGRDITERKKLEHERNKVIDDLVQRNRDLEQFSYIVSHNLRAPVANIIGISNLIQSHDLIPSEKDLLSGLAQSALGLDTVLRDLNYILKKKREVNENKVPIKFGKLIEGIQSNISSWINQEKVTFITDFSSKDGMLSVKSYLFSVLYNLISNSIKYKHPDRDPIIEIKSYLQENGFKIIFKDNGLGIDLDKSGEELFGLYKRFHFHTEGKGMGLYMVKTQLEAIGGKVYMKSEVNVGTEVTIEFENE